LKKAYLSSLLLLSTLNANDLDPYFDMSIEELLQVEVTGSTRTQQTQLDVPSSVTVFTEQEIKNLGATRLTDLVNFVPGFQSRRNGDASTNNSFTTRGHTSGRTILVLIDGHRINSEYLGGTNSFFSTIPLDNIKRVEFIRGAGSAVYGSNALMGVINLIRNKDKNAFSLRVSEDAYQASAQVSLNEDDFEFSAFIKGLNDHGQNYTNITETLGNGKTSAKDPYKSVDFQLNAAYKGLSLSFLHNSRDLDDFYIVRQLSHDGKRESEFNNLRIAYEVELTDTYKTSLAIAHLEAEDELSGEMPASSPLNRADVLIKEKTPSIEWFNEYQLNEEHNFVFGAEYRHPNVEGDIVFTPGPIDLSLLDDISRDVYGVYGQYQGQVHENILITLGLRYDKYSDFGSSVNPRLALVYKAFEQTSLKLLYSEAFRAPSMNELYLRNNPFVLGNPNLQAETVQSYEAIIVQQFKHHAFNLSYYENHMSDIIAFAGVQYENKDDAVYKGIDLEYLGEPIENFTIRASYSYLIDKPTIAYKSSEHITSAIFNYATPKINVNLSGYYHDSVESESRENMPSYFIANTKLSYKVLKNTLLYVQVTNMFDKQYSTPATGGRGLQVPNRGRESFIGLDINF